MISKDMCLAAVTSDGHNVVDGNEDNLGYLPSPQGRWEEGAPPSQHAQSGTTLDSVVVSSHEAVTTSTPSAHHLVKTIRRSSKNLLPGSTPVSASPGVHDIEWDFGSDEEKPPGSVIVKTTVTKINQEGHREFLDDLKGPPKVVEVTKTTTKVKHPNQVSNDSSLTSISDMSGEDFSKETKDPIKLAALGKQLSLTLLEGERRYLPDAPAIIKNSDVDDGYTYEEIQCYTDVNNAHNNIEDSDKRYGSMMVNSDSDSDSRGSPQPVPKSRSFSTRKTLGSSSGSDIALHEGADLSEDEHAASRWYDTYWRRSWWLPACFLLALFACVAMHGTDSPYFLAVHRFLPHAAAAAIPAHGAEYFQGQEDPVFSETVSTEFDPDTHTSVTTTTRTFGMTAPGEASADELRQSMQEIVDKFMVDERKHH
uniref:Uncharacterized protein n=2 Tax=Timema TaxID=61471 RepID=A0A7R9AT79_TIMSH|nr:unnamed protein product [Timema shepardi]CAD7570345.1 unnamed protein product [Timema californicum]